MTRAAPMRSTSLAVLIAAFVSASLAAWEIPPDNATLGKEAIQEMLRGNDYPQTSTYRQTVEFIDYTAHGQNFTQVVVTLTPDTPRLRNGKKLIVVGAEPGSEEVQGRAHRRAAPLPVHAGQHQGRRQHVAALHRVRLF